MVKGWLSDSISRDINRVNGRKIGASLSSCSSCVKKVATVVSMQILAVFSMYVLDVGNYKSEREKGELPDSLCVSVKLIIILRRSRCF